MAITAPQHYKTKVFKCDFPKLLDRIFPYAIGFTKEDGLQWSIVFSFLFPLKGFPDFRVRFSKLFGNENHGSESVAEEMISDLYDFLGKYNPFGNRYSCLYNESLKELVKKFNRNVHAILKDEEFERNFLKRPKVTSESIDNYVKAACSVLKTDIALCDTREEVVHLFTFSSNGIFSETSLLTLYIDSGGNNKLNYVFYYGIEQEFGQELQAKALESILLTAGIFPENVEKILDLCPENNHIVLTLIRLNMYPVISILFEQPHILFKLEEADYHVDPSVPDASGKSALYYAVESNESGVVSHFYNYLSGSIQVSGVSPRNPKKSILENLERLRSVLEDLRSKFENIGSKKLSVYVSQLIKFNNFHITVDTKLLEAEEQDNIPLHSTEKDKVERKKKKIIDVLCAYAEYFDFEDTSSTGPSVDSEAEKSVILQENFKNYKRYYQIIDFSAALFFFDNLFSLKQNLILPDNAYESIESDFLRFLLMCGFYNFSEFFPSNCTLSRRKKFRKGNISMKPRSYQCRIVYMERLKLQQNLRAFKKLLTDTCVQDDNIRQCLPEAEVETLISLREIRDVFVFRTVVHYLDVASVIEFSSSPQGTAMEMQGVLVIERALQVLGEHMNERSAESVSLGKSLLVSLLPADVRKNLRDIREELSHMDAKRVEHRINAESCREAFEGIVSELCTIRSQIEDNHGLLELLATKYVLSIGHSHLKEVEKTNGENKDIGTVCLNQKASLLSENVKARGLLRVTIANISRKMGSYSLSCNMRRHLEYISYYVAEQNTVSERYPHSKTLFHLRCLKVLFVHAIKEVKIRLASKKLREVINVFDDLEKNHFSGEETWKDGTRETVKQKVHILTKYEEIYNERILPKSQKVAKKNLNRSISRRNPQGTHYTCRNILPLVGTGYSFFKRKFGGQQKADICSERPKNNIGEIKCSYVESLKNNLLYLYPIDAEEKRYIIGRVPLRFREHSIARRFLLQVLEGECKHEVTDEGIGECIQKLLPSKGRKELEKEFSDEELKKTNIDTLKGIKDYYGDLTQKLNDNEEISRTDYKQYCECSSENMKLLSDDKSKELLKKCIEGEPFKAKNDTLLKYLRDRIIILENLLITSDPRIRRIWPEVKSTKTKQHIVYRIKERYIRDFSLQAAVEMLLFDCMNILKRRKDLERLWLKVSNLFNGVNLRNVLAHGNPLFEEVGRILDPDDLPSEIITKCLELVNDKSTIEAMCELLAKTGGMREDFTAAVKGSVCADICKTITQNAKWEGYASLIPKSESSRVVKKKVHAKVSSEKSP